jgi:hypothetical protein
MHDRDIPFVNWKQIVNFFLLTIKTTKMKKILLSIVAIGCAISSHAQIILNEVYVKPNPQPVPPLQEYVELYNTSGFVQNADNYSVVAYFENGAQHGFYVMDIPALTIAPRGFLVGSSQAPDFLYQTGTGHADFSWNAGNIHRFIYGSSGLVLNDSLMPYDNIFVKGNGHGGGQNGIYGIFLFRNGQLVDGLLGSTNTNTVPDFITDMGLLSYTSSSAGGNISYDFTNINSTAAGIINHVIPDAGTDNGYNRINGTCASYGEWRKAAPPYEHTPGMPNQGQSVAGADPAQLLQADLLCINDTTVLYNITAGNPTAFPVTVSLYFDANGSQFLDSGDVFIASQVDISVIDPAKTFFHLYGQEDFIFVFDAAGGCYDTMMPLNCPAAVVLPVTWKSFTATRDGSQVLLKWTTATEINNRGYNVQRSLNNNNWETVTFIETKAPSGNSNAEISYSYVDNNSFSGMSHYRLQQVDADGKYKYSEVRSVRNTEGSHVSVLIYPNPGKGGSTIYFQDAGNYDVFVTDINGRTVMQYRSVTTESLKVNNLNPGVYAIRIVERSAGIQTTERLVVSGR